MRRSDWLWCSAMGLGLVAGRASAIEPPYLTLDVPATAAAPRAPAVGDELTNLSLEDLMNIQVTSVSKQKQRIGDAAAVYVITQEDIHRSGMDTIADMLRMAPGLDVRQVSANSWAVGSRGFNQLRNNNLLVLMDGRTLYTPLFSGVYWDTVDYTLEDLDRIEVVRGPGGTLWGANAFNGVINITTKSARDTQGLLVKDYTGTDGYIGDVRYGGNVDNHIFYRVYAKYRSMNDMPVDPETVNSFGLPPVPPPSSLADGWDEERGGFRVDAELSDKDLLTLEGDVFNNRVGRVLNHPSFTNFGSTEYANIDNLFGLDLIGRWTHTFSPDSDFSLQLYYDRLNYPEFLMQDNQNSYDIEFQHRFPLVPAGVEQEIIWGGGYRLVSDDVTGNNPVFDGNYMTPGSRNFSLSNAFIQDDITIVPKRLHAIVGTKFEVNDYTGLETQPSGRLSLTPNDTNTFWASISRAVRIPARWERDGHILGATFQDPQLPAPGSIDIVGNPNVQSESVTAFEAGYRTEPIKTLSLDLSGFYNFNEGLQSYQSSGAPFLVNSPVPHEAFPYERVNAANGNSYGGELSVKFRPLDNWQLTGSYSYIGTCMHSSVPASERMPLSFFYDYTGPSNQFQIRSYYDITRHLEFNSALYYQDANNTTDIGAIFRLDMNFVWRPEKHVDVSAGVRNLLDNKHPEFYDTSGRSSLSEVPRTFFFTVAVRF